MKAMRENLREKCELYKIRIKKSERKYIKVYVWYGVVKADELHIMKLVFIDC